MKTTPEQRQAWVEATATTLEDRRPLRIWVWEDVLRDHTSGMAVVVAHDETEARELMQNKMESWVMDRFPFAGAKEIKEPGVFWVHGGG